MNRRVLLLGCLVSLCASLAWAQEPSEIIEIKLGGHSPMKVQVQSYDPEKGITLKVKGQIQTLPLSLFSKEELYACRAALADPKRAEDQFQLGKYGLEQGLKQGANQAPKTPKSRSVMGP